MNLIDGKIYETDACNEILEDLDNRVVQSLAKGTLDPNTVIDACDRLVANLDETMYLDAMQELGIDESLGRSYLMEARQMFSGAALRHRIKAELGENYGKSPPFMKNDVTEKIAPLGVLLHIAAGNADGLPAFSVLEGLLAGNINILKLPAAEGGISIRLLLELIRIEPALTEYIYVFDYSSKDIIHIDKLIDVADAVVVWGGIEAVSAFRTLIPPNIKLIEWGHKISFGYVTKAGISDVNLVGLARNITETGQLLCSSCQGIFLDTDDFGEVNAFCERFLPLLESTVSEKAKLLGIGVKSQTALLLYCSELETIYNDNKIFRGQNCSLTAVNNRVLEPSIQFGNLWVKPLPKSELLRSVRPYKNYLQTVGLCCGDEEKTELCELLSKTGVVHICPGDRMSTTYPGAAHDGEYPLRRYTKVVSIEG